MHTKPLIDIVEHYAFEGKDTVEIYNFIDQQKSLYTPLQIEEAESLVIRFVTDYQLAEQIKDDAKQKLIMGIMIFLLGIGILIYTFFMMSKQFVLPYGLLIGGLWMIKVNYTKYNTPLKELTPRRNSLYKKR